MRAVSTECSIRSNVVPKSASRLSTYWSTSARMRATSAAVRAPRAGGAAPPPPRAAAPKNDGSGVKPAC